jgi:hypothetical protein
MALTRFRSTAAKLPPKAYDLAQATTRFASPTSTAAQPTSTAAMARPVLSTARLNHARRLDPTQLRTAPQNDQHQPLHRMVNRRHDSLALLNPQWLTASSAKNAGAPSNFTSAVPNRVRLYGARKERLLGFLGVRRATRATPMRGPTSSLMLRRALRRSYAVEKDLCRRCNPAFKVSGTLPVRERSSAESK